MGKKTITFGLSEAEIDRAIKELKQYAKDITAKADLLGKRIADEIANNAQGAFATAVVDDLLNGGRKTAKVSVSVKSTGNISLVIASGADAFWAEFGTGVYYNGSVGGSPHPKGVELGMTIGGYGKGKGQRETWGFYDEDGEVQLTHGAPASMPMYNAVKTVCAEIATIAREVFK